MAEPNTETVPKRSKALGLAVPTVLPLVFAYVSIEGTMLFGERYGFNAVPWLLVGAWYFLFLEHGSTTFYQECENTSSVRGDCCRYRCDSLGLALAKVSV